MDSKLDEQLQVEALLMSSREKKHFSLVSFI